MQSNRPKPLHLMCGRPLVMHVLHALEGLDVERTVVVVGADAERVTKKVQEQAPHWAQVTFVEQQAPLGSGDAALTGLSAFEVDDVDDTSTVLVLPADRPLLRPATVMRLVEQHEAEQNAATVLTVMLPNAEGQRRVVRNQRKGDRRVLRVSDNADDSLDSDPGAPQECSTSIFAFRRDLLGPALRRIRPNGDRSTYPVADVIETLASMGYHIGSVTTDDTAEVTAVDDRWQLAMAERELRARTNRAWLLRGVTMLDPRQTFIDVTVDLGRDVTLYPGTILQGRTVVGDSCEIGPNTRLVDCAVGARATVPNTVGTEAEIGPDAVVGPFAYLEPGASVGPGERTGPFYTARAE